MSRKFDSAAASAISDAVRDIEGRSAAEIMVDVRARSGSYAQADSRFGALLAFVSLAVLVFMPWVVPPITVLVASVAFYLGGLAISRHSASVRRLFTTRRERLEVVRTHAAAAFHQRGIANTSGETGVLLYVSLLERRIEVLADRGLLARVNAIEWNAVVEELHRGGEIDPEVVLAALRALGAILARHIPADDANPDELTNAAEIQLA